MLYRVFHLLLGKQSIVISDKNGIYVLPHELLNDLRLKTIRKFQENLKTVLDYSLMHRLPLKVKFLSILILNY